MRGVTFEIPNQYGRCFVDLLATIEIPNYYWRIGGGEAYYIEDGQLGAPLFSAATQLTGEALQKAILANDYYVIFADLKAFPNLDALQEVATYEAFQKSPCEFVLLIVDCCYVTIYAKNEHTIRRIYDQATASGYKQVTYITDDNDDRTTLIAF